MITEKERRDVARRLELTVGFCDLYLKHLVFWVLVSDITMLALAYVLGEREDCWWVFVSPWMVFGVVAIFLFRRKLRILGDAVEE